jgi:NAD(P)-dependent dehydrogenase (short-subunit alcohol dehydrogenase family)
MTTILITGGHAGIGLSASRALAAKKVDLVLAGRSPDRMGAVADELRAEHGVAVSTLPLELSSLASVRAAAEQLGSMLDSGEVASLDAIANNAGGRFDGPVTFSPEGHETTFATNYLGGVLLVELLLPRLPAHGRVVYTVSGTHDPDSMDGRLVGAAAEPDAVALAADGKDGRKALSVGKRYSTSKLCAVMYVYELDRRLRRAGSSVSAIAFDPGSIPETGLTRGLPAPARRIATSPAMEWVSRRIGVTTSTLAFSGASLAGLAASDAYPGASGAYVQAHDGALTAVRSATITYDLRRAETLWNDTRRLVGLVDGPAR